jgi:hypothetical protein
MALLANLIADFIGKGMVGEAISIPFINKSAYLIKLNEFFATKALIFLFYIKLWIFLKILF